MNSTNIDFKKLSELTINKLIKLNFEDQLIALALVFSEVFDSGRVNMQEQILASLPQSLKGSEH